VSATPALELRGIVKSFGSVQALRGADFVLAPGEVHALLGENGAGKSSLLHVAYGMFPSDEGEIRVNGERVQLQSPTDARALRIGMVHQHFTSIAAFTVAENIALSAGGHAAREGAFKRVSERALAPKLRAEELSVALRQRLELLKALATGPRILLLDEPSAALAPSEIEALLAEVKQFAREGGSVALVTHKLAEVFAAADRVTVLRQGLTVVQGEAVGSQSEGSLAEAMLGSAGRGGTTARRMRGAGKTGAEVARIDDIVIRAGELIGIAAVEGNGEQELLRGVAGIAKSKRFSIHVAPGPIGFIPEDRTTEGLIPELSVTENFVLGRDNDPLWSRGGRIDWKAARQHTTAIIREFEIRASGPDAPVRTLSGGNQQKLVLARALHARPGVLIAENPTRGLDLRATAELHRRLQGAADAGVAVLLHSADLDEVIELGERVLVVYQGRVREAPAGADRQTVGRLMLGVAT
jgi:simple sugar transport system ATP-binding protein